MAEQHVVVRLSNSQIALLAAAVATPGLQGSQYPRDVINHADEFLAWLNEKQGR